MFPILTDLKHTNIPVLLCSGLRIWAMTAKILLTELHQAHSLCHKRHICTVMARWPLLWMNPACCALHPYTALVSGQKTGRQQHITVQRGSERSSHQGWHGSLHLAVSGYLAITAQTAPPSSSFSHSIKFPASSPTAHWTSLGHMERRLAFPINMAKRETVLSQTPLS